MSKTSKDYGTQAAKQKKPRNPSLDTEFMAAVNRKRLGNVSTACKAWIAAYDVQLYNQQQNAANNIK